MNISFYIAKRYLFTKSSNNAINIITRIAATGVVLGAMSLFIVLSGFGGLKKFSLQFVSIFDSDIKIFPQSGKTITLDNALRQQLAVLEGVEAFSETIEERVFLQYKEKNHIAYIKGVDTSYGLVNPIDSILSHGEWMNPGESEVVIGYAISPKLSLGIRDYTHLLQISVPKPGTGQVLNPANAFKSDVAVVSGAYFINEELNGKYIFSAIDYARNLLSLDKDHVSAIEVKLKEGANEKEVREQLNHLFNNSIVIKNRIQQNDALYKMLNTENVAVYLIFTLVLIIALFNVIGSIIMMILDKRKNMKTLYNVGATLSEIRRVFFWQGTLMSTLGGLVGIALGMCIVFLQMQFSLVYITPELPYPMVLTIKNVLIVFATITLLGIAASAIAASRVQHKLLR